MNDLRRKNEIRVLFEDTDFYVRHDGDDQNDGTQDDRLHAFQTLQGAVNYLRRFVDTGLSKVRINVQSSETPYAGVLVVGPFRGSGSVAFVCDKALSNVIVADQANCFWGREHARFGIFGGFETRSGNNGINAEVLTHIQYEGVVFGHSPIGPHVRSTTRSVVEPLGRSFVQGGGRNLFRSSAGGHIAVDHSLHEFVGDVHFFAETLYSSQNSIIFINGPGFVLNGHRVTGRRFTCWANAIIQWVIRDVDALPPGDVDGEELMGGRFWTGLADTDTATGWFEFDGDTDTGKTEVFGVGFRPRVIDFLMGDQKAGWANNRDGRIANAGAGGGDDFSIRVADEHGAVLGKVTAVTSDGFALSWSRSGKPMPRKLRIDWKANR